MPGRIVRNHTATVDGMLAVLKKLVRRDGVKIVTPGRLRSVRGLGCALTFRVSIPVNGGWKVNVRRGHTVQELFIGTTWERTELQETLDELAA